MKTAKPTQTVTLDYYQRENRTGGFRSIHLIARKDAGYAVRWKDTGYPNFSRRQNFDDYRTARGMFDDNMEWVEGGTIFITKQ